MTAWRVPLCDLEVPESDIEAVGARHAVATSSGTAALHLICAAAGVRPRR